MIVYKTTDLKNGMIYVGRDLYNDQYYYGSGKWFKSVQRKRIKNYIEDVLGESFTKNGKFKTEIRKYGKFLFTKEIIEYCNSVDELKIKEEYWIDKLDATNPEKGYNLCKVSGGGSLRLGMKNTNEWHQKVSRKIYQYDLNMLFIKEYKSVRDAYRQTKISHINKCCNNYRKTAGNFFWSYEFITDIDKIEYIKKQIKCRQNFGYSIPVYQYTKEGNFIKKWDSIHIAGYETNSNDISSCCKNKIQTAGGYIWSYHELDDSEITGKINNINNMHSSKNIIVLQYDLNNNLINEYKSQTLAAKETKTHIQSINRCCKGYIKSANGFIWKYKNKNK